MHSSSNYQATRQCIGHFCFPTRLSTHLSSPQVGTAIFSFVIATHTFSLLFLRRQWSDRTCYIILIVSWALLSLDLSVENFVLAKPKTLGPYYGVAGYWCWITPAYSVERYTTSYLFMFVSAVLSFVLYLLVFFRLRGNITLSGYKLYFHRHPKLRVGRTSDGTSVSTDDRRVGSHLTRVAQHMLWYPLVYTLLVLPQAAARFASFSGRSVPFSVTILTSSVFMLHGCINTMLFCTTRNVLPGGWRQRVGLSTSWDGVRDDIDPSNRTNPTWRFTGLSAKVAPVSGMGVEKGVEVMHGRAYPASYLGSSSPSSPAFPRPHSDGGEQLADTRNHHTRQLPPRDTRMHIHAEADGDDGDTDFDAGVDPTITARIIQSHAPPRPSEYDLTTPAPSIKVPAPVHLLSPTPPMVDDHQWQSYSSSISTSETIVAPVRLSQASGEC